MHALRWTFTATLFWTNLSKLLQLFWRKLFLSLILRLTNIWLAQTLFSLSVWFQSDFHAFEFWLIGGFTVSHIYIWWTREEMQILLPLPPSLSLWTAFRLARRPGYQPVSWSDISNDTALCAVAMSCRLLSVLCLNAQCKILPYKARLNLGQCQILDN